MTTRRSFAIFIAGTACLGAVAGAWIGNGLADEPGPWDGPESNFSSGLLRDGLAGTVSVEAAEAARTETRMPLLWLGEEYEGFGLTKIAEAKHRPPAGGQAESETDGILTVTLVYGDCVSSNSLEPGCAQPLQIQVAAAGLVPSRESLAAMPMNSRWSKPFDVRGVPAINGEGSTLLWLPGGFVVTIHAEPQIRKQVLEDLELANATSSGFNNVAKGDPLTSLSR